MFGFLKKGLEKTAAAVKKVVPKRAEIVERDLLEEAFLEADISYEIVEEILQNYSQEWVAKSQQYLEFHLHH